jgi:NAD(P)H-dependent flavin oxidoreductase YrpB (nitropropane dioxygenase family)
MVPRLKRAAALPGDGLALFGAEVALDGANKHPPELTIALLPPDKMGALIAQIGQLTERDVAAVALDMAPLADSAPYGERPWRPRRREEIAELRAAAGRPLWLLGLGSAADAEVAAEAGADGVVVGSELGRRLGAPAVIELLPEVVDAVGGMLTIAAGGPVRDGVDVLRYLAVGAELVLVDGERSLQSLAAELEYAMRLTGCAVLGDVGYDALFAPLFGEP